MASIDADKNYYVVVEAEDRFRVETPTGYCVMECRDRGSADHYVVLLNQAFEAGYKQGFRAAKRS